MSMSNFLEDTIIKATLMGEAWAITTNPVLKVALFQGDPGEASITNEVSGNAYVRQTITGGFTKSIVAGVTKATNTADITFPVATPAGWGAAVTHFAIIATISATDYMLYIGTLTPEQVINLNGQLIIAAGTLEVILD